MSSGLDETQHFPRTRSEYVTVRTQATNYAAANLYEKSGLVLDHSDLTFRVARREGEVRR